MTTQIDDYAKRPIRYQNIDGLGELGIGVLWTGFALLLSLLRTTPSSSFRYAYVTVLVCLLALSFALFYCRSALKRRLTYPRTGYVKYRNTRIAGWKIAAGMLAGFALWFAFDVVMRHFAAHSYQTGLIVWTSAGMTLLYIFVTRMDAAWRWVVLAALIAAPAVVATLPLRHSRLDTFSLWLDIFIVESLIFIVSGVIALTFYLRRNPVPEQGAE
jgi:hypothetical protein